MPMSPVRALSAAPPVGAQEGRAAGKGRAQSGYPFAKLIITRLTEPQQVTSNNKGPLLSTYLTPGTVLSM